MTRVELKDKAKKSLEGKWGSAALFTLLYMVIAGCVGGVIGFFGVNIEASARSSLTSIASLAVTSLLAVGFISYFAHIARGEEAKIEDLFSKVNLFLTVLLVTVLVSIFTTLWALLLIIPGIIAAFSYSQVYYIILDNPEIGVMEAISKSKAIMKGHKFDFFILQLSFIGWAILAMIPFGLGMFWLMPYMQVTLVNFYDSIKDNA